MFRIETNRLDTKFVRRFDKILRENRVERSFCFRISMVRSTANTIKRRNRDNFLLDDFDEFRFDKNSNRFERNEFQFDHNENHRTNRLTNDEKDNSMDENSLENKEEQRRKKRTKSTLKRFRRAKSKNRSARTPF